MRRLNAVLTEASAAHAPRPKSMGSRRGGTAAAPSRPADIARHRAANPLRRPGVDWVQVRNTLQVAVPAICLFAVLSAVSWTWYTGRWDQFTFNAQQRADASVAGLGLTIDKVVLARDPKYTLNQDIRAAIGASAGGAIVQVPPSEIRENLLSLPWVEQATVERRLPNILFIDIQERQPLAIWQSNERFHLLDDHGETILSEGDFQTFAHLPRLVGTGADAQAVAFLKQVGQYPGLSQKLFAAALVNGRRWDLHFQNGVRVLLPEEARDNALARLANLDKSDSLLDRDVVEVDLRLDDRMVVRRGTPDLVSPGTGETDGSGIFSVLPSAKPAQDGMDLGQPT